MRVLLTNSTLDERAGTELYIHDLARALQRHGHDPMVYSPRLGRVAEQIRDTTIPVTDDIRSIADPPDIIHGHHHMELMTALARFDDTPAVSVCHGWRPWEEIPLVVSQVRRFVCVDAVTRDRLCAEHGVPRSRIRLIPNFVDGSQFPPRAPLPPTPRHVLLFSNYVTPDSPYHNAAREACERHCLALDVVGKRFGNAVEEPGSLLAKYDIVLAQGRSAIEALAVGTMVIICSSRRFGPPVRTDNLARLRELNFGIRTQTLAASAEVLARHLAFYDAEDAQRVARIIRQEADIEVAINQWVETYREAISDAEGVDHRAANRSAAPAHLRHLSVRCHQLGQLEGQFHACREELVWAAASLAAAERERDCVARELACVRQRLDQLEHSATWRLRSLILRLPGMGPLQRGLERWLRRRKGS